MKFFSAQDILDYFPDIKVIGDVSKKFSNLKPIGRENKDSIIWVSDKYDLSEVIKKTKSNIIICKYNYAHFIIDKKKTFITTENPRLLFSKIIKKFFSVNIIPSIHNTAIIETDTIGKDCFIGANTVIGKSIIGKKCNIMPNVTIYDNVEIGDYTTVHSGSCLGVDGFGYERNKDGILEKIEHVAGLTIGTNVEIGSNTSIGRGCLSNTIIGNNVKINNNVHIAHNTIIGKNSIVMANVTICGSVTIDECVHLAPGSTIRNGLSIGKKSQLGLGAVLTKNMPPKEIWAGIPAKKIGNKTNWAV